MAGVECTVAVAIMGVPAVAAAARVGEVRGAVDAGICLVIHSNNMTFRL